jgi:hypothetical protein
MRDTFVFKACRVLFLPPLARMARRSSLVSDKVASAFRIVAIKPALSQNHDDLGVSSQPIQ